MSGAHCDECWLQVCASQRGDLRQAAAAELAAGWTAASAEVTDWAWSTLAVDVARDVRFELVSSSTPVWVLQVLGDDDEPMVRRRVVDVAPRLLVEALTFDEVKIVASAASTRLAAMVGEL